MSQIKIDIEAELGIIEKGIVKTLLYFDIFSYPLTESEIWKFHPKRFLKLPETRNSLLTLTARGILHKQGDFYSLKPGTVWAQRRKKGNELARKRLKTAQFFSGLIARFPFVRAIMISGSLSKNYMDEESDIDYFVVTEPGRLWLTRGFFALFKRIFLLNSHKFFCINYLVDTQSLEIEDRNLYTAIETATLIPVYGKNICEAFIANNQWIGEHFPNLTQQPTAFIRDGHYTFKFFLEKIFVGAIGNRLDQWMMQVALKRWKRMYANSFSTEDFDTAFKSTRRVSKNHPRFFQKEVLNHFREKISRFELANNLKLSA